MAGARVCVLGAGVIGLSTAVNIQETVPAGVTVTLMAEKFSPDTTSDIAAGACVPYLLNDTPANLIRKWSGVTHDYVMKLYRSAEASDVGAMVMTGYMLFTEHEEVPEYADVFLSFREMSSQEIKMQFGAGYTHGWAISTPMIEGWKYLPFLLQKFKASGGRVIQRRVERLPELYEDFDVVVNCTGLGAKQLLGDPHLVPTRGQIIRVVAPWIKCFMVVDNNYLILPGQRYVVMGGTFQEGNWSLEPNEYDGQRIWKKWCSLVPSFKKAEVLKHVVGLRPTRTSVRLEKETVRLNDRTIQVVHNYGHGGAGVGLHWGCAQDATELVLHGLREIAQAQSRL